MVSSDLKRLLLIMSSSYSLDAAARLAVERAVDSELERLLNARNSDNFSDPFRLGIGSGSTMAIVVEYLGRKILSSGLNVICVPTSFQTEQLILSNNLTIGMLAQHPKLDLTFDGADECDSNLTCIKGGGGCFTQEKVVASCSDSFVIIGDHRKHSYHLGEKWKGGLPVEVIRMAWIPVKRKIEAMLGGQATVRISAGKMGPLVTDNGNFLLDWMFPSDRSFDWKELHETIKLIPGVVETGLFVTMAHRGYFGYPDGTVKEVVRPLTNGVA